MRLSWIVACSILAIFIFGCEQEVQIPTPDVGATVEARVQEILANQLATTSTPSPSQYSLPTVTPLLTPTSTPIPSPTVTPTSIPTPTATPSPSPSATATSVPTPTATPTVTPSPSAIPTPTTTPVPTPTLTPTPVPSVSDIVRRVSPAVVRISTNEGSGSGIVIDPSGYILTNYHVVSGSTAYVHLIDGRVFPSTLLGFDEIRDLAVLKIDANSLTSARLEPNKKLSLGDEVIAIGYPLGGDMTVTRGIISAFTRLDQTDVEYIQTDAAVNPGNSGGPLIDITGNVIGIITSRYEWTSEGRVVQNVGFAISLSSIEDKIGSLRSGAVVRRPTATPVTTKRIGSYPKGWSIEVPKKWKQDEVNYSFEWLHREFRKGDWLFWVETWRGGAVLSIRVSDSGSSKYTPESYLEQLLRVETRSIHVDAEINQVMEIQLVNGVPAKRFEVTVNYYTDVNYEILGKGVWHSTWIVAVLRDRTIAVEALVFGNDEVTRDQLEAALRSLEVFSPQ